MTRKIINTMKGGNKNGMSTKKEGEIDEEIRCREEKRRRNRRGKRM